MVGAIEAQDGVKGAVQSGDVGGKGGCRPDAHIDDVATSQHTIGLRSPCGDNVRLAPLDSNHPCYAKMLCPHRRLVGIADTNIQHDVTRVQLRRLA